MNKFRIISITNNDYILENECSKYNLNMIFYIDDKIEVGDIIYLPVNILREVNIYAFGPINNRDINLDENDIIKIITKDKEMYLQRYYG